MVSEKQSPELATGRDLDRWANNFGITRRAGSPSNGLIVFTTNQISADIPIPAGTVVTSRNGLQYRTIGSYVLSVAEKSRFAANGNRLRSALDLAGITDAYAIEIPVRAGFSGTTGNISSLQIISSNLGVPIGVTNLSSFNGGANIESDVAFRARVFAVFSGSNTGTAFGYRNAAISVAGVNDAIVIEPGSTLMLRDGTEVIQVNDGSFRILDSGTGGKVDLYILGKQLEEVVESYVFTDRSGAGQADDERNDYIVGQGLLDPTLTSEERRVQAFNNGRLPLQPVDTLISVIGSSSGILAKKSIDTAGTVSGNYELIKDTNVATGGSPFGFDKIRFISNDKEVEAESIIKQSINSVDALRFSGTSELLAVFQDISVVGENSKVSSADKRVIKLSHSPVVTVSRVTNTTTGEVYVIESQNLSTDTGLNDAGEIIISGRTLPSSADVLAVDYIWRLIYDKFTDYNGEFSGTQFVDPTVSDSIDWGVANGITAEVSTVERTQDGLEYQVALSHNVSRVTSMFSATITSGVITGVQGVGGSLVPGVIISASDEVATSIASILNENGVEIYNTVAGDGSFASRTIILPSDAAIGSSTLATIFYNKTELYNISNGDGAFSNNIITLPSEDILEGDGILSEVNSLFLSGEEVYVDYVAEINEIVPSLALTLLPINGSESSNTMLNANLSEIVGSNQPIFYGFDAVGNIIDNERFGPTRLSTTIRGSSRSGKIKVAGESLTRYEFDITAGISISGLSADLTPSIKDALGLTTLPSNIGIAKIDSFVSLDNPDNSADIVGQKLNTNLYGFGAVEVDLGLSNTEFVLPSTNTNNALSFSSGEKIRVSVMLYNSSDTEELFFAGNGRVISDKIFGRVTRISVSSGFRSPAGTLIGSILIEPTNQPGVGLSYSSNYRFKAPTEGERITVRYNLNSLISNVTANLENVRSITADVLVKESPILLVDVRGEIIVNDDFLTEENTVLENVSNAVVNLLNSSTLGSTVDYSDVINAATAVTGVDSVNISLFNEAEQLGRKSFVQALDNQSIAANEVNFQSISRKDFRIT